MAEQLPPDLQADVARVAYIAGNAEAAFHPLVDQLLIANLVCLALSGVDLFVDVLSGPVLTAALIAGVAGSLYFGFTQSQLRALARERSEIERKWFARGWMIDRSVDGFYTARRVQN